MPVYRGNGVGFDVFLDGTEVNIMCRQCFDRGIQVIGEWVHLYQKHNHRIMICGHCYRPVLRLDTHLDVRELPQ